MNGERSDEFNWDVLLWNIKDGKCTPFLGAGVYNIKVHDGKSLLPKASELAEELVGMFGYPRGEKETYDLSDVAQCIAIDTNDWTFPKQRVSSILKERIQVLEGTREFNDFLRDNNNHLGFLAQLPFKSYITTNYDDLMYRALKDSIIDIQGKKENKRPTYEICRWNKFCRDNITSKFDSDPGYKPSVAEPMVFHLHGQFDEPDSMVLTEDDYYDFLINIPKNLPEKDGALIPNCIRMALSHTNLLFIGYRLADTDFRVLFHSFQNALEISGKKGGVAVHLDPKSEEEKKYLEKYFKRINISVFWGTAQDFIAKLNEKWKDFLEKNKNKEP